MDLTAKKMIVEGIFGFAGEDFQNWLEEVGYYDAPASKNHHGAEQGALFDHHYQTAYELVALTERLGLKWERPESPYIVGMLHDFCKLDDYIIDEDGEIDLNKEQMYSGHGYKSIVMLMGHIDLTEEEKMCICYHMGAFVDQKDWGFYSRAVKRYPNVLYTHTADMIASQIKGI